jgi:hypothetical protein
VRLALEPLTPTHGIVSVAETRATIETAIELLKKLPHLDILAFAVDLEEKMPELIAPLEWLEQHLTPVLDGLDADAEAFILWAWQHRHQLNLDIDTDIPERLRSVVRAVWDILGLFHRSSGLAESVGCKASAHSWLRPYLQIHRGIPQWLLPLLQLFWNHHTFERGKRAGSSPLELAGVEDAPSLAEVLDQLLCPRFAPRFDLWPQRVYTGAEPSLHAAMKTAWHCTDFQTVAGAVGPPTGRSVEAENPPTVTARSTVGAGVFFVQKLTGLPRLRQQLPGNP